MPRVDLLVRAPHVLTMTGGGVGYRADTAVAVDRGRIVAVGPAAEVTAGYRAERVVDGSGQVLLPGLIDAHMHTGLCLLRGLAQDTRRWMMQGLAPYTGGLTRESSLAGTRLAVVEALRCGTTTFGDYGRGMDAVCRFLDEVGVRGHVTSLVREVPPRPYGPGELYDLDPALGRRTLDEALALHDRWDGAAGGRIRVLLGPQGPDFLSAELLVEARRQAIERGTLVHLHTAQGDRETEQIEARYGQRPIPWLDSLGHLDEHLLAVHLTDATDDEAALVARRGAAMVLCSGSIAIIDGVVPPAAPFLAAGGRVALGSDQAPGNNCHNMFNEMKLTALLNKVRAADPEVVPAWQALRLATIEGAQAVGLGAEIGSIEEGKRADLVLVDLRRPGLSPVHTTPVRNIVPNLVYAARGDEVTTVIVDGAVVVEEGRVATVDEAAIVADAQRLAPALGDEAGDAVAGAGGPNVDAMRAGRL